MKTGRDFEATHVLDDGLCVRLRHIRPDDGEELRRAFARLSPTSRFRRFFGGFDTLDDATVRYLTSVDGQDHVAIVAYTDSPDLKTDVGLGVARFIRLPDEPEVAEAAIVVVDDFQGRGIGALLGDTLAAAARERGITRFRAEVLASNGPAREPLEALHAHVVRADDDSIVFDVPLARPDGGPPARLEVLRRILGDVARQVVGFARSLRMRTPP
ncbi:MAG: GNAT family N-acetyltransferase [Deltaproteobacteria bacterium]